MDNTLEVGEGFMKYILDLLKSGEEYIKLSHDRDVVLVLGTTGAGKSTLTEFLTRNNEDLVAVERIEGSGDFVITDIDNKISINSTIISKTVFPDLYVHGRTGALYYDCPGFSDTRSAAYDISTTYFNKMVIDSTGAVKILFLVNYSSVRIGVDRQDFVRLVRHITTLMKDIEKYRNSIALIVTKVDNQFVKKKRQISLVPDEKVVETIADFLRMVKKDIQMPTDVPTISPSDRKMFISKASLLIDIFLENTNGTYKKIGVFRRPDEPGLLSQSELLQDGKENLENLIDNYISYVKTSGADFGFTISPESMNYVQDLGDIINESITDKLREIGDHIQNVSFRDEANSNDVSSLSHRFQMGVGILSKYEGGSLDDPKQFVKTILGDFKLLNKTIPTDHSKAILYLEDNLTFLETMSGKHLKKPVEWFRGLAKVSKYFNDSKKWYVFLNDLEEYLSEYQLQKHKLNFNVTNLIQQCSAGHEKIASETDLKELLEQIKGLKEFDADMVYTEVKELTLSPEKLTILERVLNLTLRHETTVLCKESKRMYVRGQFVSISNVIQRQCNEAVQFIEILASKKVFFDTDINKIGKEIQLYIIAPIWEVVDHRKILLDGKAGQSLRKAYNGNGQAGAPGGPGGAFFGVAGRVIGSSLDVSSVGGNGGHGGKGRDGASGREGIHPATPKKSCNEWFVKYNPKNAWEKQGCIKIEESIHTDKFAVLVKNYKADGCAATDGGNGRDGGVGGLAGRGGTVKMVDLSDSGKVSVISRDGNVGKAGKGGSGGVGARHGETIYTKCRFDFAVFYIMCKCSSEWKGNGWSASGRNGIDGRNMHGRKLPRNPLELGNTQHIINEFKKLVRESLVDADRESYLIEFINKLGNDLRIKRSFVDERVWSKNQLNGKIGMLHFHKSLFKSTDAYTMHKKESERSIDHITEIRRRKCSPRSTKHGNSSIIYNISGRATAGVNLPNSLLPLLNEMDCMKESLTEVDSDVLKSSSNLLLWNLVLRRLCYKDRKRTRKIKPVDDPAVSHTIAFSYYATRHQLPSLAEQIPTPSDPSEGKPNYYLPPKTGQDHIDYSLNEGTKQMF